MLLQFSARNFASFKDELILDLMPSSDKSHQENRFESTFCSAYYN